MTPTPRSVSVFGLGYVGSVVAACLAHKGNRVVGIDLNPLKVEMLDMGKSPIIEARMDEMVAEAHHAGRLRATRDIAKAVAETEISFVCVGTPSLPNGKLDLSHISSVCREIGESLKKKMDFHLVVIRSTTLPGSTSSVAIPALETASGKRAGEGFAAVYNPEFMREGSAVADFLEPPFTVLGVEDPKHAAPLRDLYHWAPGPIFETSLAAAEMIKYASNAFHALKVSFANEIGTVAKRLGVDSEAVTRIFLSDTRLNISPTYLSPGFAFGGSCLPKDLKALSYKARELDLHLPLIESIMSSNDHHIDRAAEWVLQTKKKRVGMLGLSFKAGTDDLRESPQVKLVKRLLGEGCKVKIWDPEVSLGKLTGANRQFIEEVIPHIGSLLCSSLQEVVDASDLVVIGNRAAKKEKLQPFLRSDHIVFDLVNLEKERRPGGSASYEGICW
ncbi:MAG TPA: UDP-glucose/GDP-mannose dehydrogenase family protein [Terriglobia bacterium]|nr:UDP-glucose/GDP-mannose dehydrogenase family protein [Terriglobia bacterium]